MQTETIDRLFLELSQVSQATTAKELALKRQVDELIRIIGGIAGTPKTRTAFVDVVVERVRQITDEGFSTSNDDGYLDSELAWAGACYALAGAQPNPAAAAISLKDIPHALWPWALQWFKPTDRRRDLVKAAALIIAEIERLDRQAAQP